MRIVSSGLSRSVPQALILGSLLFRICSPYMFVPNFDIIKGPLKN